jgi:hypothetical protein
MLFVTYDGLVLKLEKEEKPTGRNTLNEFGINTSFGISDRAT